MIQNVNIVDVDFQNLEFLVGIVDSLASV